ncbi:bi-domain-containing oxidoreductase [Mesorhizobium sp. M0923]|uniref:bi-domain-containing oxidoreductase n=1 Tax=Mesorhizobium sp. M0923 TaxID=2957028 RepID=UPI00333DE4CB
MKQILQSLKTGATEIADVPCPAVGPGQVLIRSSRTLVSAGTERMLVEFGKAGLIGKARQQPERVKQVLDKIRTDGLAPTLEAVFNKLDQPLPLGYCNVGTIIEIGAKVSDFAVGDRVVSNGKHAEAVAVAANLCAKVPDGVYDDEAAFAVLGAIALQGIRLVQPTLGEAVVVTGLGLIGLMAVQLLRAHGCRVLGLDFDSEKLALAELFGAETVNLSKGIDPVASAMAFSRGRGVDAVLITASAKSNELIHHAALMSRKRGRIVLVGVVGLELSRADFYEKELSFQVSCSYGPGRYDPNYEERGQDYPVAFVRWTEQRNFEAVLDMMAGGHIDVKALVSHRFKIGQAEKAYALIGGGGPSLGILLSYPGEDELPAPALTKRSVTLGSPPLAIGKARVGFIGSGNYATSVLVPAFKAAGAQLVTIGSSAGVSSVHAGRKFGFEKATTDTVSILEDLSINAVVIATRHDTHAGLICEALKFGKHVFVEKPLALSQREIQRIEIAYNGALASGLSPLLTVGFNRRFSPHVRKIKQLLTLAKETKSFVVTVNAGDVPAQHWTHDLAVGGGRIVGEACHFVDLLRFLAASPITSHAVSSLSSTTRDTVTIQLEFGDGSIGSIHYFANGSRSFPKERLEVFCGGRILQLDNFRKLLGFGWPGFSRMSLWRQDKGQKDCAKIFVRAVEENGSAPIPFGELVEVSSVAVELAEALRK